MGYESPLICTPKEWPTGGQISDTTAYLALGRDGCDDRFRVGPVPTDRHGLDPKRPVGAGPTRLLMRQIPRRYGPLLFLLVRWQMAVNLYDLADEVNDEESFLRFMEALAADRDEECEIEASKPSSPYAPGALG